MVKLNVHKICYKDSADLSKECDYQLALEEMDVGEYTVAQDILTSLGDYKDAKTLLTQCICSFDINTFNENLSSAFNNYFKQTDVEMSVELVKDMKYDDAYWTYLNGVQAAYIEYDYFDNETWETSSGVADPVVNYISLMVVVTTDNGDTAPDVFEMLGPAIMCGADDSMTMDSAFELTKDDMVDAMKNLNTYAFTNNGYHYLIGAYDMDDRGYLFTFQVGTPDLTNFYVG